VIAERITVLTETPLEGPGVVGFDTGSPEYGETTGSPLDARQRWLMIAEHAYLLAADRGFEPGHELEDWLRAEQEIDERLARG
jgi:hypothetical protein